MAFSPHKFIYRCVREEASGQLRVRKSESLLKQDLVIRPRKTGQRQGEQTVSFRVTWICVLVFNGRRELRLEIGRQLYRKISLSEKESSVFR
jgi:hypothetical protein